LSQVGRLIAADDKAMAMQPRLTFILEQLIADAISRQVPVYVASPICLPGACFRLKVDKFVP